MHTKKIAIAPVDEKALTPYASVILRWPEVAHYYYHISHSDVQSTVLDSLCDLKLFETTESAFS